MVKINLPKISVVLNVYNESQNIQKCLARVRNQNYPQDKIEIILVDDNSTDDTVEKAQKFKVKVYKSGYRNRERAKSIGLKHALGELILFLDADVFLVSQNWLFKAVNFLLKYPKASALQSIRWQYRPQDNVANRYCNLFGINDPFPFFLQKRGALMATEEEWPYPETILERGKDYFLVQFTKENLPTLGAQGYLARKDRILKTNFSPYFFHLDSTYQLVERGYNQFIMAKLPIEHQYVKSISQFYLKLYRNLILFLKFRQFRQYTYDIGSARFFLALFLMLTLLYPLGQGLKGFLKKRDWAWFLHPLFSFTIPLMYAFIVLTSDKKNAFKDIKKC